MGSTLDPIAVRTAPDAPRSSFKRVLTGSMAGAVLEWYDLDRKSVV